MSEGIIERLENSILDSVPSVNIKASPSANSQNDGLFNSEENLKWANKKLSQKPFIVGKDSEDVDKHLSIALDKGTSIELSSGMFSSDGYLFKIAKEGHLDYDEADVNYSIDLDTYGVNEFVLGLSNSGNQNAIKQNLNDFVYSEYQYDSVNNPQFAENWTNAYKQNKVVGYICINYSNDFLQEIQQGTGTINYKNTVIDTETEPAQPFENADEIREFIADSATLKFNQPFAFVRADSFTVYYPIKIKYKFVKNESGDTYYIGNYFISFTDIFSMFFSYDICPIKSRSYPNTESTLVDIDNNAPIAALQQSPQPAFSNCILTTMPRNLYDFDSLYNAATGRKILKDDISGYSGVNTITVTGDPLSDIFTKISAYDAVNAFSSSQAEFANVTVKNTLSYYCIKDSDIPEGRKLNYDGNKVPVCFMTSDGRLCPDGLICADDDSVTVGNIFIEGYLHYIKRMYLTSNNTSQTQPTEEEIKAVTTEKLVAWADFVNYYPMLFKYISLYMQLGYSSLVDNVIYPTGATDSAKVKFNGCGTALKAQYSNLNEDTFGNIVQPDYSYSGVSKYGTTVSSLPCTRDMLYHKDIDSDNKRFLNRCDCEDNNVTLINGTITDSVMPYKYSDEPVTFDNLTDITLIGVEDPINYIRRCRLNTSYSVRDDAAYQALTKRMFGDNLTFYKWFYGSSTYSPTASTVKISVSSGVLDNVVLDDYLMPMKIVDKYVPKTSITAYEYFPYFDDRFDTLLTTKYQYSVNAHADTDSMINGFAFEWDQYQWRVEIPLTISLNYDGLDYLRGTDLIDVDIYKGIEFSYKLPTDITDKDLVVFNLVMSTDPTNSNFDKESCSVFANIMYEEGKTNREAYIHISKIYGDNGESLRSLLENKIMSISDELLARLERLELTIYGPNGNDGVEAQVEQNTTNISSLTNIVNGHTEDINILSYDVAVLKGRLRICENDIQALSRLSTRNRNDISDLFDIVADLVILSGVCGENVQYSVIKHTERAQDTVTDPYDSNFPLHSTITTEVSAYLNGSGETFDYGRAGSNFNASSNPIINVTGETHTILADETTFKLDLPEESDSTSAPFVIYQSVILTVGADTYKDVFDDEVNNRGTLYKVVDGTVTSDTFGIITYKTGRISSITPDSSDRSVYVDYRYYDDENTSVEDAHSWINGSPYSPLVGETRIKSLAISSDITKIGSALFYGCENLTTLKTLDGNIISDGMPNSIVKLGNSAFYRCGFGILTIPESVGDDPDYWDYIDDPTLPEVTPPVGKWVFMLNKSLQVVVFKGHMIGDHMFALCPRLDSITIGTNLKSIGHCAFSYSNLGEINYQGTAIQWDNIIKGTTYGTDMWYQGWLTGALVTYGSPRRIICSDYIYTMYAVPNSLCSYLDENHDPSTEIAVRQVNTPDNLPEPSSLVDPTDIYILIQRSSDYSVYKQGEWCMCKYDEDTSTYRWGSYIKQKVSSNPDVYQWVWQWDVRGEGGNYPEGAIYTTKIAR